MKLTKVYRPKDKEIQSGTTRLSEHKVVLCQLESISTKHSFDGVTSIFTVKTAKGELCSIQRMNETELTPSIGSTLVVEYEPIGNGMNNKTLTALSMVEITSSYKLPYLDQLFMNAKNPKDLIRLLQFVERLHDKRIKQLLVELFQDSNIAIPFITLPASHTHHHSYAGGLLEHSIECAEWTENTAYSAMSTSEAELCQWPK